MTLGRKHPVGTYNDTIFAYLNMVPDGGSLDDSVHSNVHIVAYLHRIVIEVSAICFVRWPRNKIVDSDLAGLAKVS